MSDGLITVFGGTGFLGRRVVHRALQAGRHVRVASRHPDPALFAQAPRPPEQVTADVRDPEAVVAAATGASVVVNCVALYVETRSESFDTTHVISAGHVAQAAKRAGAVLVHVSGIGVDRRSKSAYVRARALGEERVQDAYAESVILRPSALFGPGDALLGAIVPMIRWLPVIPLFGEGDSRLQPVHVDDVARAVMAAAAQPAARGNTYELGGPEVFTYRELIQAVAAQLGRRRWLKPVSFKLWRLLAVLSAPLSSPPVTRDQLELVRRDNVVRGEKTFSDLGIEPQSLTAVRSAVSPK